ncbi:hypothetical protein HU751_023170 [Pseudomonas sp. BW13M1]|uniref:Uncharacterized protein n=1 Tax=Pseudomonas peradeniyensis TaxID=2745488 RepID=A0A923G8R0_9PSED|nr:hypothetical protein [Pseudomonas peradeniyensis]MBV4507737.1 hypothetical protein [Pseudomonas peradeniyensis]
MNEKFEEGKAWRQSLKAGDGVVITERDIARRKSITTVERVTATQVIVSDRSRRFNKQYGREVGTTYGATITPVTSEARARILADKNRSEFSTLTYRADRLSDEEISAMLDAVKALRASKEQEAP